MVCRELRVWLTILTIPRSSELQLGSERGCEFYFDILPPTQRGSPPPQLPKTVDCIRGNVVDMKCRSIAVEVWIPKPLLQNPNMFLARGQGKWLACAISTSTNRSKTLHSTCAY